jgi:hypothetical protein
MDAYLPPKRVPRKSSTDTIGCSGAFLACSTDPVLGRAPQPVNLSPTCHICTQCDYTSFQPGLPICLVWELGIRQRAAGWAMGGRDPSPLSSALTWQTASSPHGRCSLRSNSLHELSRDGAQDGPRETFPAQYQSYCRGLRSRCHAHWHSPTDDACNRRPTTKASEGDERQRPRRCESRPRVSTHGPDGARCRHARDPAAIDSGSGSEEAWHVAQPVKCPSAGSTASQRIPATRRTSLASKQGLFVDGRPANRMRALPPGPLRCSTSSEQGRDTSPWFSFAFDFSTFASLVAPRR